jgi:acyl-CoA thioesterase-1
MKKGSIIILCIILFCSCANDKKPAPDKQVTTTNDSVTIAKKKTIVFFGNSLTAGYGLSPSQAFPQSFKKRSILLVFLTG